MISYKKLIISIFVVLLTSSNLTASEVLTNDHVTRMIKAGISENIIIKKIKSSPNQFKLSVDDLIKLKKLNISEKIIQAMITEPCNNNISQEEIDYQTSLEMLKKNEYDSAIKSLKSLTENNSNPKYHISLIKALIGKSSRMKKNGDSNWELLAREAQGKLKGLYNFNLTNPDYWINFAKFHLLIGNINDAEKALQKMHYYNPDYSVLSHDLVDVYYRLALDISLPSKAEEIGNSTKKSYLSLLESSDLTKQEKGEIYCELAELELYTFSNIMQAINY